MVESIVYRTRKVLNDLLERQEVFDIIFHLKDQVVIRAHSYVLSGELFLRKTTVYKNNKITTFFIMQLIQINSIVIIVIHHWYLIWILVLNKVLCGLS